ncbi:loganic acid O-methyltransferase-like [Cornus florida]|uniref:loganic acid O-methyltransferase-like n=1 Tax=Cornus florida TaxID=4283 RepID=UPI00289DB375|nr:loganic acid O-methyltransferase-like [Cornus florida]
MAYTSSEMSPMNGGDGLYSNNKNSTYQVDVYTDAILGMFCWTQHIHRGENIVESIKLQCQSHGLTSEAVEFQVFFNDLASNDFNMLFNSLQSHDGQYFAAGVPGSFHGRLFPKASLYFVNASYAVQWLSRIPMEVVDEKSPAWNKGRIHYTNAPDEVVEAYSAQFAKDVESFLNARTRACPWRSHGSSHPMYPSWDPSFPKPSHRSHRSFRSHCP